MKALAQVFEAAIEVIKFLVQDGFGVGVPVSMRFIQSKKFLGTSVEFVCVAFHVQEARRDHETDVGNILIDLLHAADDPELVGENSKCQQHEEAHTQNHPAGD